uniref:Uncharacterized protein n=1 Tax=Cannabis sativa TaxID=3483 RepID=A0A803Q748_CANSA
MFASSGLPQDPIAIDLDVCVLATNGNTTNPMDVSNPAISAGIKNLATKTRPVDTTNHVGLNRQPLLPKRDPPLASHTEGMTNVEQPLRTTTRSGPLYYAGEMGP